MITSRPFGHTVSGEKVTCYDLKNQSGMTVSVLDFGCTIQQILVMNRQNVPVDVALGYDTIDGYEQGSSYFGAFVGRYANRIRNAGFVLNGTSCRLSPNDGKHHLHGSFSKTFFSASVQKNTLVLHHDSPPEEEGYPGTLSVWVRCSLKDDNVLELVYDAETDEDTVLNLTNHTYFNLNGHGNILGHTLRLAAEQFAECDDQTLPTGRLLTVEKTAMDFRSGKKVGEGLVFSHPQIELCGGYDHHYVLNHKPGELCPFAELIGDQSGIRMIAETTQPGVQLYTGNYVQFDASPFGKNGIRYEKYAGLCLETQHAPDSPNLPSFPSVVLRAGERFHQMTRYCFES